MTSTNHYRSNLRDIEFNLFEMLRIGDRVLGQGRYSSVDPDTVRQALHALEELCSSEMAASYVDGDRTPLVMDEDGTVHLPESVKKSLRAYWAGDWHRFDLPEHMGGHGLPPTIRWAGFEMVTGANPAATFYLFGTVVAAVIDKLATPAQKKRFIGPMLDAPWGGTMALTEADAGSDVGVGRAKARHVGGEIWELEGTKRFITNGDFDAVDNIVHLVLARPEGAAPGTKGLSLFIVPKFWVNEDGTLGERNGIRCGNIEKKMGIKGSATCEMVLGGDIPCRGLLMGEMHDGIRQMFHLIEHARMGIGFKSMSATSSAYLNALDYCRERIQGSDLKNMMDKAASRVPIIRHPDVRRMLMAQKAHAEGMRALCFFTASMQDEVEMHGGHGNPEADRADKLNDLLLPLVKGYCSEKAYEMLVLALQCLGGSGYCQDFPMEQYIRDQKIDSIYEGTTHIQSLDLVFRKVARDGGGTLRELLGRIRATLEQKEGGDALARERAALERALGDVEGIFGTMLVKMQESLYHVGLQANRILESLAELVIGWLLVRQGAVAVQAQATASGADKAFYEGKIAAVRYYCHNVLPGLTLIRKLVENSELSLTEIDEAAF